MKEYNWLLVFIIMVIGSTILFGKESWTAFVYPEGLSGRVDKDGPFDTKEECLTWSKGRISIYYNDIDNVDYECGKNCKKMNKSSDMYICDETVDG